MVVSNRLTNQTTAPKTTPATVQKTDQKANPPLPFIPFALPEIGEEEIAEVVDSLRSGWLTTGPKTKQFEQAFAEFVGVPEIHAIAVNSATAGLHLALEAIGIGPGDEVITTVHTFTATAAVIRHLGAAPVLVDVDPVTLNIDTSKIEAAITPRTKVIMPVHFGGLACDMATILTLAKRYGLKVVEDAAHAIPTTYQGQVIGSLNSDVTVYSFYANKTITTGEGGMIVTRNPEIAKRCQVMRLHGISRDAFDRFTSTKPAWHYEVVAPGCKYNMTDIAASIGIHQLRKAQAFQQKRAAIAARYDQAFADLPLQLPAQAIAGDVHSWHLYAIRLGDDVSIGRNSFIERLAELGIGCSVHYIPLHFHPYWRDTYQLKPEHFPCSSRAYERLVSLPIYTRMTDADQARVIDAVTRTLAD
jgi:dTDP-4-amino-4,6-dideoxygalactose transaminase